MSTSSDSIPVPVGLLTKRQRRELIKRPSTLPGLLDSHQLTAEINISYRTLDEWKKRGVIPFFKVGRWVRFDLAKVRAALDQHYEVKSKAKSKTVAGAAR
jgi:excisionase family DNA binding protein